MENFRNVRRPGPGEIDLFHVGREGDLNLLDASEFNRYQNYGTESVARMFLKGRSALKEIGALYTGNTPCFLQVEVDGNGKPYFRNCADLHFNLSHSGEQLSVAFSRDPVGLDLERKGRKGNYLELARRFFHPEERARVEEGGGGVFLEIWTAKEAMLKLAGEGIAAGLDKVRVMENGEGFLESTRIFLQRFETETCVGAVAGFSPIQFVRESTY